MTRKSNGYEHLAAAIIEQAIVDWLSYKKQLHKIYDNSSDAKALRKKIREIELFFKSEWFTVLSEVSGEELLNQLNSMFESGKLEQSKVATRSRVGS